MDRDEIEAGLLRKGFRETVGDHRYFIYYNQTGKKTSVYTKTSHGSSHKEIGDNLVSMMARQCRLPKKLFVELVDCTLARDKYEKMLIDGGHIKLDA